MEEPRALCAWVRTFGGELEKVSTLGELGDGVGLTWIFGEILGEEEEVVQPLGQASKTPKNWALGASRLRRLMARVKNWYAESLESEVKEDAAWDAEAASKTGDEKALTVLVELILGVAVRCENRAAYVGKIMSMTEEEQATLMVVVDRALTQRAASSKTQGGASSSSFSSAQDPSTPATPSGVRADADEAAYSARSELAEARRRIAELTDEVEAARHEAASNRPRATSRDDELEVAKGREAEARASLERATAKVRELEVALDEANMSVETAESERAKAQTKCARLEQRLAEVEDEADVGRDARARLERAEEQLEKLRKKVDDAEAVRRDNKDLDEQNARYLKEVVALEEKLAGAQADRERLKDLELGAQADSLRLAQLEQDLDEANADLSEARDGLDRALDAKRFFEDEVKALRRRHGKTSLERGSPSAGGDGPVFDAAPEEDSAENDAVFADRAKDLRARVAALERDNAKLAAKSAEADRLRQLADDAQRQLKDVLTRADDRAASRATSSNDGSSTLDALKAENQALREALRRGSQLDAAAAAPGSEDEDTVSNRRAARESSGGGDAAAYRDSVVQSLEAANRQKDEALAKANADRQKLELYTRKTLHNVQEKYAVLLQTYKNQIKEKQDKIVHLETRIRADRANHKREETLVVSAIYDLGQRVIEANLAHDHPSIDPGPAIPRSHFPPAPPPP